MKEDLYDKASTVVPMGDVIGQLLSDLHNAIGEAKNQAENGSELGMAVAVGNASAIISDLLAAWKTVKK